MKKLPMAYFPGCVAIIYYRKVDKWAKAWEKHHPFFETWQEAHSYMLEEAKKKKAFAEKELASAIRHLKKVEAMQEPPQKTA